MNDLFYFHTQSLRIIKEGEKTFGRQNDVLRGVPIRLFYGL